MLEKFFEEPLAFEEEPDTMVSSNLETFMKTSIQSKIRQRRSQMLVHSCAYYIFDTSLVDDDTWQKWANELSDLQNNYTECHNIGFYDREFYGWNGDSGAFLPLNDKSILDKTLKLMKNWDKHNDK